MLIKKILIISIIFLFLGVSINPSVAIDNVKILTNPICSGNTLYVGGGGSDNYSKIQDAIDNTSDGDTVFVYDDSSPYYENLIIDNSINLIGEDRDTTIIDGDFKDNTILVTSSSFTIKNIKVINSLKDSYSAGIFVWENGELIKDISIINCIISNSSTGIRLTNVKGCIVTNCTIYNNEGHSLYLIESYDLIITKCTIFDNGLLLENNRFYSGEILTEDCEDINVSNCQIYNNIGFGIYSMIGKNINIYNNTIQGSLRGLKISVTDNFNVYNNNIYKNDKTGIDIIGIGEINGTVNNNKITENGDILIYDAGISIRNCSSGVIIKNNDISSNKKNGILFLQSCDNIISKNNFIDNEKDAYFINKNFQGNMWLDNYWSRPRFLPKLIFGLISKNVYIPWLNIDWHPAQKPYDISGF
jgi:nitrous oxidase accessory protein